MTFAEAYISLTQDVFPENAIQTFGQDRLDRAILDAAADTAAAFGFMVLTYRVPYLSTQSTKAIPTLVQGGVTFNPFLVQRIERASFAGWNLRPGERVSGQLDEAHFAALSGVPRFWYWKPETPTSITILPKAHKGADLVFDAVQVLPRTLPEGVQRAGVQIWAGMHVPWQDIVVLTAASRLFDSAYESDNPEALSIKERLSRRRQEFALFLQGQSLATVPVGGQ